MTKHSIIKTISNKLRPSHLDNCFIVGSGHSGTSLLIRLLGEHPDIYAIPYETELFWRNDDTDFIKAELDKFDDEAKKQGKRLWVEKTPRHVHYIDKILAFRPKSKFVGITRDPRDVACSIRERGFTFEQGLNRWIDDNEALLAGQKKIKIHTLKLEDLTKNTEAITKDVLTFLGLPYQDLSNYHRNTKNWYTEKIVKEAPKSGEGSQNHKKLRNWQINQPIFKDTSRYKSEMSKEDKKKFTKLRDEIDPIATALGYDLD